MICRLPVQRVRRRLILGRDRLREQFVRAMNPPIRDRRHAEHIAMHREANHSCCVMRRSVPWERCDDLLDDLGTPIEVQCPRSRLLRSNAVLPSLTDEAIVGRFSDRPYRRHDPLRIFPGRPASIRRATR